MGNLNTQGTLQDVHDASDKTLRVKGAGSGGSIPVTSGTPAAADILNGYRSTTTSDAATAFLTIPAGRTWVGTVGLAVSVTTPAASPTAGQALGVISIAGVGATPAGDVFGVEARSGANAATGTTGDSGNNTGTMPLTVIAPAGNAVTLTLTTAVAGSGPRAIAFASGSLVAV